MAHKDVLDQIRDLQSFIDDFAADAVTITSPEEKTELFLAQEPDEKTEVEEEEKEKDVLEEKTEEVEEKILVEPQNQPLSMLSYDLNLSDDFSSLLTQFKEIKVSPIDIKLIQKQQALLQVSDDEDATAPTTIVTAAAVVTPKLNKSFLLNDLPPTNNASTKSRSRRTSISSKKSQRSAKSARRLQNEKKIQQQHKQQHKQQQPPQKYIERSYDEMMRIPDIYERLAFYEKTLDLCLKAESPISNWCKLNKEKGKPIALLEGYNIPSAPIQLLSPEIPLSENTFGSMSSMSSTFSGSISMFLKKAGGSQSIISKRTGLENKSFLVPSNSYTTPHTPSNNYGGGGGGGGSGLFGRSMSRLNLSRSTQIPRYDDNAIKTPVTTRLAPLYYHNNRVSATNSSLSTPKKKRSSMDKGLSPLNMDYSSSNNSSNSNLTRTPISSSSTPTSFGSTTTINSQGESISQTSALDYVVNVLPQIEQSILQNALYEAKGDPMVAISIAVSQNKLETTTLNHYNNTKKSTNQKLSPRHYSKVK